MESKLKVTLLTHTPDPERLVAAAARLCYSPDSIDGILEGMTPEKTGRFIDMLAEIGHESPVEHASFTFGVEGVSRSLLAQLTRHRIASFSVQSQRYVSEGSFDFVVPPEIAERPEAKEEFLRAMEEAQKHYDRLAELLRASHEKTLLEQGKPPKEAASAAKKMAIEDARFVLPNACDTKLIVTMNVRSLYNFFRLRCCNRAQWEIRAMAWEMLRLAREAAPGLFRFAGPACLNGACSEGRMCCGRQAEVREKSKRLAQKAGQA